MNIDTDVFSKPTPKIPDFNMEEYRTTHAVRQTIHVTNPTPYEVRFAVQTGTKRLYSEVAGHFEVTIGATVRVPAGETVELPAEFESYIHNVWCKDKCYTQRSGPCKQPWNHPCCIVSSTAPQLVIEDRQQALHPSLIPEPTEAEVRRVGAPVKGGKTGGR